MQKVKHPTKKAYLFIILTSLQKTLLYALIAGVLGLFWFGLK
jgi:site-specific recombinase